MNLPKVREIQPLARLKDLRELAVTGSVWARMNIHSFEPLTEISGMEFLHLTNINPADAFLKPLENLQRLKQLDIANSFSMEDFAKLAAVLPETNCIWFKPYVQISFEHCKKCEKETMVMLTGKRKSSICSNCDVQKLTKHIEAFEMFRNDGPLPL